MYITIFFNCFHAWQLVYPKTLKIILYYIPVFGFFTFQRRNEVRAGGKKNDNYKLSTISKFHKAKYEYKAEQRGPLKG